jgi:hypothetical protein
LIFIGKNNPVATSHILQNDSISCPPQGIILCGVFLLITKKRVEQKMLEKSSRMTTIAATTNSVERLADSV